MKISRYSIWSPLIKEVRPLHTMYNYPRISGLTRGLALKCKRLNLQSRSFLSTWHFYLALNWLLRWRRGGGGIAAIGVSGGGGGWVLVIPKARLSLDGPWLNVTWIMVRGFDKRQTSFASLQWDETLYGEICIFMKSQMHEIIATGVRLEDCERKRAKSRAVISCCVLNIIC